MKKLLFIFILIIPVFISAQNASSELIPYRKGNLWGFANQEAKIVINPKYDSVTFFGSKEIVEGRTKAFAIVKLNKKYGCINKNGAEIIPIKYDSITFFEYGFAIVKLNEKYGYINKQGIETIPIKYNKASSFNEFGVAKV